MICPACGCENLPGVDECEECLSTLTNVASPKPRSEIENLLRKTKIKTLESAPPIICHKDESIEDCVRRLQEAGQAHILVTDDGGKLLGIVTERDFLYKVMPSETNLESEPIATIMTRNPHTLSGEDSISLLLNTMAVHGYRRVPIRLKGRFAMVTVRQLFNYLLEVAENSPA